MGLWYMHQIYDFPSSIGNDCYTSLQEAIPDSNDAVITENLLNLENEEYVYFFNLYYSSHLKFNLKIFFTNRQKTSITWSDDI